ncbi:hypothetical protein [Serratia symbiotica]|uniref:hypothetical protein n=1 Tax=Serratia symbiotica TaxID=138074 RepID=UPI001CF0BA37|nr:hypothetical protein [Serratia symbiotica]
MIYMLGVIFALFYLYSMMEDVATRKVSNKMSGLKSKYDDAVKQYNLVQIFKKS